MKKVISMLYILSMTLFADMQEQENQVEVALSEHREALAKNKDPRILLTPIDIENDFIVFFKYNQKYEIFKKKRESFETKVSLEKLNDFYVCSLEETKMKNTGDMQLAARSGYEDRVLSSLEKDLNKNHFLAEERSELLDNIEELLTLDNRAIYELIENRNEFYAKNIKKYITLMMNKSTDYSFDKYVIFNENSYQKFLFYLNKGEELAFEGVELNDFSLLDKYIKYEMRPSEKEINTLKESLAKQSVDTSLIRNLWIRTHVYLRYIGNNYSMDIHKIKKRKELFESLYLHDLVNSTN